MYFAPDGPNRTSMRIATWNLDRSGVRGKARWPRQQEVLAAFAADIVIVTEAHRGQSLAFAHQVFSRRGEGAYAADECAVAIWSRWPMHQLEVTDDRLSVCVELAVPGLHSPLAVYGTLITYGGDGVATGEAKQWERHRAAAADVARDCTRLRALMPQHALVLAGDLNMNFDGTRGYGLRDIKESFQAALSSAGMKCLTADDMRQRGIPRANVDHIWTTEEAVAGMPVLAWYDKTLSDHNGVAVDLCIVSQASK